MAPKLDEGVAALITLQDHVAATPTIAAIGAAIEHVLLAPKRRATITPAATGHVDADLVNKAQLSAEFGGHHTHPTPVPVLVEADMAIGEREQRPVTTHTHTRARVKLGTQLADDDAACEDELPIRALHATVLGVRVATVSGASLALLMCHFSTPRVQVWVQTEISLI
jgi:hypothetical protein